MEILEILRTRKWSGLNDSTNEFNQWCLPLVLENAVGKCILEGSRPREFPSETVQKSREILRELIKDQTVLETLSMTEVVYMDKILPDDIISWLLKIPIGF